MADGWLDKACSAYRDGKGVCKNGFFQLYTCRAGEEGQQYRPYCLRDELPEHWVDERGYPRFIPKEKADNE